MIEKQYKIISNTGFAWPATLLVNIACSYESKVCLEYAGKTVDLKEAPEAILNILSLRLRPGSKINIWAAGTDEQQVLHSIEEQLQKDNLILN